MTLKGRVLLIIAAVHLLVMMGAGYVLLHNARTAVAREITAAQDSAAILIRDFVSQRSGQPTTLIADMQNVIIQPRHVRIRYLPEDGTAPIDLATPSPETADDDDDIPRWFLDWVTPDIPPIAIPFGRSAMVPQGVVEVVASPEDEAAEVWEDVEALFLVWSCATLVLLLALGVLVGRALAPLKQLEAALGRLRAGDYACRAAATRSPDLLPIGRQIDRLAASLQCSETERHRLSGRLLELREEERRDLARELHDELGPCLFGLSVMADSLRTAPETAADTATDIDTLVARIRTTNARILNTLRPSTIGNLPLREVVTDLVADMADDCPGIRFTLDMDDDLPPTSEILDATVYRILQEGITNALRHGQADAIAVHLFCDTRSALTVMLEDDGKGPGDDWKEGRGLLGMRERVDALKGSVTLSGRGRLGGATLNVKLPLAC